MHTAEVLPLHSELELTERLHEWHALNVSNGTSKLQANKYVYKNITYFMYSLLKHYADNGNIVLST